MNANTPQERVRKHLSVFDFSLLEDESWPKDVAALLNTLAAVTAERDDARREVEHQKWIKAKNTEVLTGLLNQARQMLADAEKKIASMELDESLREEDERFADPL